MSTKVGVENYESIDDGQVSKIIEKNNRFQTLQTLILVIQDIAKSRDSKNDSNFYEFSL